MATLFVGLALITFSNLYGIVLNWLKVRSTVRSALSFAFIGIFMSLVLVYLNYPSSSTGELVVFSLCLVGAIVRIGYAHFKLSETKKLS